MKVDYVDHMGSDLSVVNAARVSFAKVSTEMEDRDERLIRYLAEHKHWTPFGHTSVSLRIKAPIFVARQLGKHQVGLVWNEVSRRYVDDPPECYAPESWRGKPENSKQGSSEDVITTFKEYDPWEDREYQASVDGEYRHIVMMCENFYSSLIDAGVCPEQARMVLPQSMMTEWIWTGNLVSFANMCKLRLDPHTQKETRDVAQLVNDIIAPLYPVSWKELMK